MSGERPMSGERAISLRSRIVAPRLRNWNLAWSASRPHPRVAP
jgi:hypothetical protein